MTGYLAEDDCRLADLVDQVIGDSSVVDLATRQFEAIIAGQNDRIWNALEKLALRAPDVFAAYWTDQPSSQLRRRVRSGSSCSAGRRDRGRVRCRGW